MPRPVFDLEAQYKSILDSALTAVQQIFPVEAAGRVLTLDRVWVDDKKQVDDFADQKRVRLQGKTWGAPIYGSLTLSDSSGKTIDQRPQMRIMAIPKWTPRYGFIVDGNEYAVKNQLRLRSGAYSKVTDAGGYETQVMSARGHNYKIKMDPESSVFTITPSTSTANIKLYPVLVSLGMSHGVISQAWGKEVTDANARAGNSVALTEILKFYKGLFNRTVKDPREAADAVNKYLDTRTEISKDTTKTSLGSAFTKVTAPLFVAAGKRLLSISRQDDEPDDKNSLVNKELHSVDTFINEHITKSVPKLKARIRAAMGKKDATDIRRLFSPAQLSSPVMSFFSKSSLATPSKQVNPVEIVSDQFKVTLMGEGGITSDRAIPDELRHLHGSQAGFLDPLQTPESGNVGTILSMTLGSAKRGNDIVQSLVNLKTGRTEEVTPSQSFDMVVAFPKEFERNRSGVWKPVRGLVQAMTRHKEALVPARDATHMIIDPRAMFSVSANLIPFLDANDGSRAGMAAKQIEQALPLVHREKSLIKTLASEGETFQKILGKESSIESRVNGTVSQIEKDWIHVKDASGKVDKHGIYNNFPLNQKTFYQSHPVVKVGDQVKQGQLLADSNYTKDGEIALGTNLRSAYIPFKGNSFEDGIVVSERGARKLTSEHIYRYPVDIGPGTILDLQKFLARFPNTITSSAMSKLDSQGVVKVGTKLQEGDVMAARLVKEELAPEDKILSRLRRGTFNPYRNRSVTWDEKFPGEVTDVVKSGKTITIVAKTEEPAQVGDKLAMRHGNKGVITKIIPESEMPQNQAGEHMEILLNPNGIPSRMNMGQLAEAVAGKVARKTGQDYLVDNFKDKDVAKKVLGIARQHGITDKEDLIDPESGDILPQIGTGVSHVLKLNHPTRSKFSARSMGHGYDENLIPTSGHGQGGQSMDIQTMYAALAHGAKKNLKEMATIKAEDSPEFWRAYMTGGSPPPPKPTFAFKKFTDLLQGAGVNMERKGDSMTLMPLLDREVTTMTSGEIRDPLSVRGKDMVPEKKGLFDPEKTGGLQGEKWTHMALHEPIPHPTFEEPVKVITGLRQPQYDALIAGTSHVDPKTSQVISGHGPLTGGMAIQHLLKQVDVKKDIDELKQLGRKQRGSTLNATNKRLRYLMALDESDRKPEDYVVTKVPIVPPILRPLYPDQNGNIRNNELNMLYRDLMMVNNDLRDISSLPDGEKVNIRKDVYDGFKALVGLGTRSLSPDKNLKGIVTTIAGEPQAKFGFFRSKLLKRRQDLSGRSTAIPEPDMGIDEIGLPKDMAWKIFRPHTIRDMTQNRGKTFLQAQEMVDERHPEAYKSLQVVASKTPVMMNRAPTLHKFGLMSFMPKLVDGQAIRTHPLINKGFNLDHDGDTVAIHTPVLPGAIEEAKKMLPSQNLFNPATDRLMTIPDMESLQGLYEHSKTPIGQADLNRIIPAKYRAPNQTWDPKHVASLLDRIAREDAQKFPDIVNQLKDVGNHQAYKRGVTLGLSDFQLDQSGRNNILRQVEVQENKIVQGTKDPKKREEGLLKLYQQADTAMGKVQTQALKGTSLGEFVAGGGKGKAGQVKQMAFSPVLYNDPTGKPIPMIVKSNYSEGMSPGEYWSSLYGSRKGAIDKVIETSEPGALSKDMLRTANSYVISGTDCKTKNGETVMMMDELKTKNAIGHVLSESVSQVGKAGQVITPKMLRVMRQLHVPKFKMRSPLVCEAGQGVCQLCYGQGTQNSMASIGENVGVIAAQSIGEPATQLVMRTFHTGGVASVKAGITSQFDRLKEIMSAPKNLPGSATLATRGGRVSQIERLPTGGQKVFVDGESHFVSPGIDVKVKVGDMVARAQPLSAGKVNPHDLLKLKGIGVTRSFLSDELHKTYNDSGLPVRKVHTDILAKAMTDYTQIHNEGDHWDFVPGDYAPLAKVETYNRRPVNANVKDAIGRVLSEDAGGHRKGTPVTEEVSRALSMSGIQTVKVFPKVMTHTPMLTPMSFAPLRTTDWMNRLNARDIKTTIREGAAKHWRTTTTGIKPIPAYAFGATFGDDDNGYY